MRSMCTLVHTKQIRINIHETIQKHSIYKYTYYQNTHTHTHYHFG